MFLTRLFPAKNLWSAAKMDDINAIERLVAEGHDVNAKKDTSDGETPLHVAARHGKKSAIKTLVRLGARINAKDDWGSTPLVEAVNGCKMADVVELLLGFGADINMQQKGAAGMTALDCAVGNNDPTLVDLLLTKGATTNVGVGSKRSSPVVHSISSGNKTLLKRLIEAKADVNAVDSGRSGLGEAAYRGRKDFVELLLEAGANPNVGFDPGGYSALMCAVAGGHREIVEKLWTSGAHIDAVNPITQETALDIAENRKNATMAEYLRGIGAKRATELLQSQLQGKANVGTSWQLEDDSFLSVKVHPWPPREGDAQLKAEVSEDDYGHSFAGTVEYQISTSKQEGSKWVRLFDGREDEEGNVSFSDQIKLVKGMNIIQFRIQGKADKECVYPEAWKFEVR